MVGALICFSITMMMLFVWLFIEKMGKYKHIIEEYSNDYILYPLFSLSFFILNLFKFDETDSVKKPKTNFKKKLINDLHNLYGYLQVPIRYKFYISNLLSSLFLTLMVMFLFMSGLFYQGYQKNQDFTTLLEKPKFNEESRTYTFKAEIEDGNQTLEKEYSIEVQPAKATEEEIDKAIEQTKAKLISGFGDSVLEVYSDLNLIREDSDNNVSIVWSSNDLEIIDESGIVFNKELLETVNLDLFASLYYDGTLYDQISFPVSVKPYAEYLESIGESTNIFYAQKELEEKLIRFSEQETPENFELPTVSQKDVKIKWLSTEETKILAVIFMAFVLFVSLILYTNMKISDAIKLKAEEITIEFPEFLSKLVLLISAGTPVTGALDKIASDYSRSLEEGLIKHHPLYDELALALDYISGDRKMSPYEAFEIFAKRCKVKEAIRFSAILVQYFKTGTDQFTSVLKMYADEGWGERKRIAERRGKNAETKLLMPILIIFLAIMLIMLTPITTLMKF